MTLRDVKERGPPHPHAPTLALAAASPSRLLVAAGPLVYDLDVTHPEAPRVRSTLKLRGPLSALRVDEIGKRAYGVSQSHGGPVLTLTEERIEKHGEHDVAAWVERTEAGELVGRVARGRAQVARVVR